MSQSLRPLDVQSSDLRVSLRAMITAARCHHAEKPIDVTVSACRTELRAPARLFGRVSESNIRTAGVSFGMHSLRATSTFLFCRPSVAASLKTCGSKADPGSTKSSKQHQRTLHLAGLYSILGLILVVHLSRNWQ